MKLNAWALLGSVVVLLLPSSALAQVLTYTDTANPKDSSWSNSANWNGGAGPSPGSSTTDAIQIGVLPGANGGALAIDTGANLNSIGSLTFNATVAGTVTIEPSGPEDLQINGGITNLSSSNQILAIPTSAGASATYAGGTAGLTIGNLTLGTSTGTPVTITTTGNNTITSGLTFIINSSTSFSKIIASSGNLDVSTSNPTISFGGTYTGTAGDLFQVATGSAFTFDSTVNTASLTALSASITPITTLIKKGIIFFQPTAGGNLINTGVVLPLGNDSELNPIGTAATNITFAGGELLTSNNAANDTGGGAVGTPFSTTDTIAVNTTGTIAATTGTTATYGGVISNGTGTGALTIGATGATGTVVFTANNTYTGGSTIFAGTTLQLGTGGGTGSEGSGNIVDNGALVVDRNNTINDNAGIISGAGTVTVEGGGTFIVTVADTYTGASTVTGTGTTLTVNGSLAAGTAMTLGAGTILNGTGTVHGTVSATSATISGTGLVLGSGATFNSTGNVLSGTETGTITVATGGAVTQSGTLTGNVILTNGAATSFTGSGTVGTVTMNGGGDSLSGNATLTTSGVTVNGTNNTISSGTVVGNVTQSASSALAVNGAVTGTDSLAAGTVTLSGTGSISGVVTLNGTANTIGSTGNTLTTGGLTVNGTGNTEVGTVVGNTTQAAGSAFAVNGALTGTDSLTAGATTLAGTGSVSGVITMNGGGNTVGSTGNTLTATSGVTVNGTNNTVAGTVTGNATQAAASSLAVNGTLTGTDSLASGATTLAGTGTVSGVVTMNGGGNTVGSTGNTLHTGGLTVNSSANTVAGTVVGNATQAAGSSLAVNGTLTGTNGLAAGATTLSGTGSVTGAVTMNGGGNVLNGTALTVNSLSINGTNNTLSGTETATNGATIAGTSTVSQTGGTFTGSVNDTSSGASTFAGAIAGAGNSLTMNQAGGMITLTGTNTYTGATTITAGTVLLSGSGSIGASAISIASAGTLAATGTTNSVGGGITNTGGTINLQNNATNTLNGTTLAGNGTLSIDIGTGGTSDKIALSGAFSGTDTINVDALAGAAASTAYTFISAGSGLSASDFTLGVLSGSLTGDTATFNQSGNTVTLTLTASAGYYFTGRGTTNPNDFNETDNYNTSASGGVVASIPITGTTNIFIGSTTPTPANVSPSLTADIAINSLTITPSGTGALIGGGHVLTINNGVLVQTGAATATLSTVVALGNSQAWTVTDAGSTLTDSGGITDGTNGPASLTKAGLGTLILGATDTFSGAAIVNAGALKLTAANALEDTTGVTVNGGALQLSGGETFAVVPTTLNGSGISNAGALESLSGVNTYGGAITLASNATIGSDTGSVLDLTGTITGSGFSLTLTGAGATNISNGLALATGNLTMAGTGTATLNAANPFTGMTTISSGKLALGPNGSISSSSGVTISGTTPVFDISAATSNQTINNLSGNTTGTVTLGNNSLTVNTTTTTEFDGVIAGAGGFTKAMTGTLTLGGTNTYVGPTTITAGTLQVNGSTAAGSTVGVGTAGTLSGSGTVNGNATLTGNGVINLANPGNIAGTLGVTGGNWNGAGSVTGAVTSSSGTFTIGNGANLTATGGVNVTGGTIAAGNASSTITGSVNYTSATASTYNGVIAGAGNTLTLNNATTSLTLGGINTYTGATTVAAGNLIVNGSIATGSAMTVGTNQGIATLSGTGSAGSVALVSTGANVAHLAPGATANTAGTLHVGSLNIGNGSELDIDLSSSTAVGGSNDLITLNGGTLTFGGQTLVDFNALGTLTTGTAYTLINGAGSIAGFNANDFTVAGLANNLEATFTDTASSVLVTFSTVPINAYYYTGTATAGNFNTAGNYQSRPTGGTTETVNLGASTGNIDVYIGATTPAPPAAPTITLSSAASINSLNFTASGAGATIAGASTLTIGAGGVVVQTGVAGTETISAPVALSSTNTWMVTDAASILDDSGGISGGFGLTKTGAGTLILGGTNTYSGATTVSTGTLEVDGSTATTSAVSLASGTSLTGSGTVGGTTMVNGATIHGNGMTLTGLVTFNGPGNVLSGTETATAGVALVGTAAVAQSGTLTGSVNSTSSGSSTFSGTIAGAGSTVTMNNAAGTLTLSGANSYGGATTLSAGTLDVTGAGTLGGGTSALNVNGGTLNLGGTNQAVGAVTFGGASTTQNGTLTGTSFTNSSAGNVMVSAILAGNTATLTQSGTGMLLLTQANTFGGGATISNGTVLLGNSNALGSGAIMQSGGNVMTSGVGGMVINAPGGYTQTAGTLTLQMNAEPTAGRNAANDFLNVGGTGTFDGTLAVKFNFVPLKGDTFDLINATTLSGTALLDPVISPAGFKVSVALTGTDDSITVTQTSFALAALLGSGATPNQTSILNYIDQNVVSGPLFTAIASAGGAGGALSSQTAIDVANQMNPVKLANFANSVIVNNQVFSSQLVDNYLQSGITTDGGFAAGNGQIDTSGLTYAGPGVDPSLAGVSSQLLAWSPSPLAHGMLSDSTVPVLGGVDMQSKTDTKAMAPESNIANNINMFVAGNVVLGQTFSQPDLAHSDQTTGGVQFGADYRITPHLRAGVMFAYNHTDADLDNNGSKATLDSYAPGVYASYAQNGWYANAMGSYGFNSFTEDRQLSIGTFTADAKGAPSGDQISGDLDGGYNFHMNHFTFGPVLGVQYTHLDVNAYTEDGANSIGADESVSKQEADSLRSRVGGRMSYDFTTGKVILTPHFEAAWQHEFMDNAQGLNAVIVSPATAGAAPFTVRTPNPSRDSALIDAGLNAQLCGQVSVFGDYLIQAGQDNYFGQSVQAGVKIGF